MVIINIYFFFHNEFKVNAKIAAHTDCGCVQLIDKIFQVTPVINTFVEPQQQQGFI